MLRHVGLLKDIEEGVVKRKRGKARPRLEYFTQINKDIECETFRGKELAVDRVKWSS